MKTIGSLILMFAALALSSSVNGQVATGGGYTLERAVVGNGGGTSSDAKYNVIATLGHPAAGGILTSIAPDYGARAGFWSGFAFGPTAADATVSGRVITAGGNGIRSVRVTLSGGPLTTPRHAISGSFGYFTFTDIPVGHTYVVTVHAKLYTFAQPSRAISLLDNVTDIEFVAGSANR